MARTGCSQTGLLRELVKSSMDIADIQVITGFCHEEERGFIMILNKPVPERRPPDGAIFCLTSSPE